MIGSFKNQGTGDVFNGVDSKAARKVCPTSLTKVARRRLEVLDSVGALEDLKSPGSRLEKLKDDRAGQHAIRINDQYRVCFIWSEGGAEQVAVVNYH